MWIYIYMIYMCKDMYVPVCVCICNMYVPVCVCMHPCMYMFIALYVGLCIQFVFSSYRPAGDVGAHPGGDVRPDGCVDPLQKDVLLW